MLRAIKSTPAFLRQLLRDNRGTSMIEAAIVVPVLVLVVLIGVEIAMGFQKQLLVQQGADRAANFAFTAGMTTATASLIQTEAATAANVATSQVTVTRWLECSGTVQGSFTGTCSAARPARYVSIAISDSYAPKFGVLLTATSIPLRGYAEVRIQ